MNTGASLEASIQWREKRVLVVGMGRSGQAATQALVRRGAQVTAYDDNPQVTVDLPGASLVTGKPPSLDGYDLLVVSPGVPADVPLLGQARQRGLPVWGELELGYRLAREPRIVGITGTNGKTTTTALLGHICREAGCPAAVAGNIGTPLTQIVDDIPDAGLLVLEISSFQLETIVTMRARVAVFLNLTPDHLDRHHTMEEYLEVKARLLANQTPDDWAVLNFDDPAIRQLAVRARGRVMFFSARHRLAAGVYVEGGVIGAAAGGPPQTVLPVGRLALPGPHNLENCLAAVAVSAALELPPARVAAALESFPGISHRLEEVAIAGGVKYVNDSKATNPDAAIKALESFTAPIVLIAGGRNKGASFEQLAGKIKEKVRYLVLVGEARDELAAAVTAAGFTAFDLAPDFAGAVELAVRAARPGDVVLLAPACASWDMFRNYEERGDTFRHLVRELTAS